MLHMAAKRVPHNLALGLPTRAGESFSICDQFVGYGNR
jgi:hypothetical protein